jgi:cell division transport system permease protein
MARRVDYYFKETIQGLRRNGLMAFAAISTVFISLFLFGGALLIGRQVNLVVDATTGKVEVAVYLRDSISQDDRNRLYELLDDMPVVSQVTYESKEDAYQHFIQIFKNQPALTQNVSRDALPASFRVKLADPQKFETVAAQLQGQPGIERIVDQRSILKRLFAVSNVLRWGAYIASVVILISAAGLIGNTVRMAVFARRKEIGIMKLVGATNWFIRIPFLIEGVVEGLLGAGAAILGLFILKRVFVDPLHNQIGFMPLIQGGDLVFTIPILLLMGVAVAIVASLVAMRRFLEV